MYYSPRRPSTDGTGGVEAWDGLTPLHLACMAGLDKIVQFLVQENAQVNIQVYDSTRLFVSIETRLSGLVEQFSVHVLVIFTF